MRKSITKRGILIGAVNHYDKMSFERPVGQLFGQIIVKGLIYTSQKERMGGWCWGVVSMTALKVFKAYGIQKGGLGGSCGLS